MLRRAGPRRCGIWVWFRLAVEDTGEAVGTPPPPWPAAIARCRRGSVGFAPVAGELSSRQEEPRALRSTHPPAMTARMGLPVFRAERRWFEDVSGETPSNLGDSMAAAFGGSSKAGSVLCESRAGVSLLVGIGLFWIGQWVTPDGSEETQIKADLLYNCSRVGAMRCSIKSSDWLLKSPTAPCKNI